MMFDIKETIENALNSGDYKTATEKIKILNESYRNGTPLVKDSVYDKLIETLKFLNPENEIFKSGVIEEVNSERKERLKFPMFSLEKDTSIEEIKKWLKNKGVPLNTLLVVTAKYDGISILKDEDSQSAWSRGDGTFGETMHKHYKKLNDKASNIKLYTIGEMIIPKTVFASHIFYRDNGEPFKNARNMIAGLKNSDTISEDLKYAKHVRYGFADEDFTLNKSEQLDFICKNLHKVPYKLINADKLNIEELNNLFVEWGNQFDIDGLVIDIDDKNIRKQLGRERNNNPSYTRAFKNPEWSEKSTTTIIDIEWNISKQGYLKPVAILEPIDLEGVTVSRVTLNNAKYVKDNNLGIGSEVVIIRSGMVIPKIVEIIKSTGFKMPKLNNEIFWNDNGVELIVENTDEQEIKKIISFFKILGTENVSEGIINQLYKNGYTSIKNILEMNISDLEKLEKFGKRKAEIVYTNIKKSISDVNLPKLMHASGMFNNLGSKKLELVCHFKTKPTIEQIIEIEGFSEISANAFINGYNNFYNWLQTVPQITIENKLENNSENMNDLNNMNVVFTGVRRQDLVDMIISRGGKNLSTISKNVTHLICKDKNSTSSKMNKAKSLGIEIMNVEDLEHFLKK